jgi:alkyl sulfatase BDS1-like metallo-beta-lactamase superfamily hydrolase
MVLIADEFFTGIPNLHTIHGSKPRLPDNYINALDRVLELGPEWLFGSHIIPIQGKEKIAATVARYRDVTQYLWDQSIRLINKGYTPVELQHALKEMPDHFWDPPYTVPMYGTPVTTVPEFFTGWVSWFSGDSTDMLPTEPKVKAERFVALMGGLDAVLDEAKRYHSDGDHQFAAELAQLSLRANPDNEDARLVKAAALRARGYQELNPIVRSWYLTGALELEGAFDPTDLLTSMTRMLGAGMSVADLVGGWRYLLDADKAGTDRLSVGVRDGESGGEMTVTLRNGVLITTDGIGDGVDVVVSVTAAGLQADEIAADVISGNGAVFDRLIGFLDREVVGFRMHQR